MKHDIEIWSLSTLDHLHKPLHVLMDDADHVGACAWLKEFGRIKDRVATGMLRQLNEILTPNGVDLSWSGAILGRLVNLFENSTPSWHWLGCSLSARLRCRESLLSRWKLKGGGFHPAAHVRFRDAIKLQKLLRPGLLKGAL
jgi:hypothetical protein